MLAQNVFTYLLEMSRYIYNGENLKQSCDMEMRVVIIFVQYIIAFRVPDSFISV